MLGKTSDLNDQQRVIDELREELGPGAPSIATRPSTSSTVNALREVHAAELESRGLQEQGVSQVVELVWDMSPDEARRLLVNKRSAALERDGTNHKECWLSATVPSHPAGYMKMRPHEGSIRKRPLQ